MLSGAKSIVPELTSIAGSSMRQTSARRLATTAQASVQGSTSKTSSSSTSSPSSLFGRVRNTTPVKSIISPEKASSYISSLLSLPSSRPFPADLALRILTHKSYRGAQVLGQGYTARTATNRIYNPADNSNLDAVVGDKSAGHNARLTFLGKRAMISYLLMFIHQHALDKNTPIGLELEGLGLLNPKTKQNSSEGEEGTETGKQIELETKVQNLINLSNLGRNVGSRWGMEHVMRWQSNLTGDDAQSRDPGALKIYGEGVQAIVGGTMMQYGSPAAHRLFHLQILPTLAPQLRDPGLVESVDKMRNRIVKEMGGERCVVV